MDEVAAAIGIDPIDLRRRNFLHEGDTTATQQLMNQPILLDQMLDKILKESQYEKRRAQFARENPSGSVMRGLGIAAFYHGAGFTGSGERYLNSLAGIDVSAEKKVRVLVSSTEFGQGTNTVLTQIAAEALTLDYCDVLMAPPDTSIVPNSGPTVASRTAMVVGRLIERACRQLIGRLRREFGLGEKFTAAEFFKACENLRAKEGKVESLVHYEAPPNIFWDDQKYQGEAYPAFAWSIHLAQVAVDKTTYSAEVEEYWTIQEVGRVLNPVLARGQIEGGVAQGVGYALYEKVLLQNGHMLNNQMTNYIMPTAADVPLIHVRFEEIPFQYGGYGAKGIGELPHDGPAPAILNAIKDATGVSFRSIPLLPEDLFSGLFKAFSREEVAAR
jgi:CO/xanthine dehydrogenase Mo-binding subunit